MIEKSRNTTGDAANGVPVVLVVVVLRVDVATVEVQVVSVVRRVCCTRPVVAVRTRVVQAAIVVVAGTNEIQENRFIRAT